MQRTSSVGRGVLALAFLAACGGGEDSDAAAFPGEAPGAPLPAAPAGGQAGDAVAPALGSAAPAGSEGMSPELGLDPAAAEPPAQGEAPAVDPDLPEGVLFGNGRVVEGSCTLVCLDGSTDADAAGQTDGWGFESGRSCLVPQSELELSSEPCDIPELAPLPALPPELPAAPVTRPEGNLSTGFFVSGGRLFDRLGNDFVMRGINHPVVWFQGQALEWLDEIATTGSNSVRLVWETDRGAPDILRASIERSVELGLVPMVEMHDVTGSTDLAGPAQMAEYYVDELRDILLEFEPYLLVNIANEWGAFQTTEEDWVQAYLPAIAILRDAGLNHTLVIDADNWGQRGETIIAQGARLLDADPQHNILFSTHMYQDYRNPQTILNVLRGAQAAELAIIVGEFGFQHGTPIVSVPYTTMVDEAARLQTGYLAWSWTGNSQEVGYLDLSVDGTAANLTGWGDDIINGMNGIRSTAQPASLFGAP